MTADQLREMAEEIDNTVLQQVTNRGLKPGYVRDLVLAAVNESEQRAERAEAERDALVARCAGLERGVREAVKYLEERGIRRRGTIGRTILLPALDDLLDNPGLRAEGG